MFMENKLLAETIGFSIHWVIQYTEIEVYAKMIHKINSNTLRANFQNVHVQINCMSLLW